MNSQRTQRIEHMAHIVAVQKIGQNGGALCEGGQQQGAVGNTFEPGRLMVPSTRAMGCNVRDSMKLNSQQTE
jgi:hypothetical protein